MSQLNRRLGYQHSDNPGNLNKRVELLKREARDNGAGGKRSDSLKWVLVDQNSKVWASIEPLSSDEKFRMNRLESEITHRITIRYRKDITRSNRLRYKGREFQIESAVNWQERDRFLVLIVKEEV
ncbi:phage head closure protein [Enterococcus casseliflavus]|uniref:phage head closure protein n=1 Tax=Enterococcus casseliflavus TaxID=37734 RepID=UPI0035E33170